MKRYENMNIHQAKELMVKDLLDAIRYVMDYEGELAIDKVDEVREVLLKIKENGGYQ